MVLARILRTLSAVACLTVVVSFAMYGLDRAGGASHDAQAQVSAAGAETLGPAVHSAHHTAVRQAIDDANDVLTAPFAALAPDGPAAWGTRVIELLSGLLAYGLGLGALARTAGLSRLPRPQQPGRWAGQF